MTLRCDTCGTVYNHREDHKCAAVDKAPRVVHGELVVHAPGSPQGTRHGMYRDAEARREYKRLWARAKRLEG